MTGDKERSCETCVYWKKDWGIFTATGWTGMGRNNGYCRYEIHRVAKQGDDFCHNWTPKGGRDA